MTRGKTPSRARKKGDLFSRMQKPKNLLLIIPLGAPHFKPDLPKANPAAAKPLRLVFGDVVVQNDKSAVFVSTGFL